MTPLLDSPFVGMCFDVSAEGRSLGSFSECSGLTLQVGTEDYKEGGNNHFVHKLPVHATPAALVLKKGLSTSTDLWDWIQTFSEQSRVTPKLLQIQLRAPGNVFVPLRSWVVHHAYPIKWDGPKLDAMRGEVIYETVELAHRGVTLGA